VRPLSVVVVDNVIELGLLLQEILRRRLGAGSGALDRIETPYVSAGTHHTTPLSLPAENVAWDLRETSMRPILMKL
jgi:hypothetical protein